MDNREAFIRNELKATPGNRQAFVELERQSFQIAFEQLLEHIADGRTLQEFCTRYHQPLSPARLRAWIYRTARTREAYLVAKAIGAEAIEDELIRIADGVRPDGSDNMEDTPRSTLKINTRKWLLGVWDRRRYGESKHIEQTITQTLDVTTQSTASLQARLLQSLGIEMEADYLENTENTDESDPLV